MDMYSKYKSPLGYSMGDNNIDTYGVDHNSFSTREEVAYQMARQQRENQMIQNYNDHGVTKDYPQYGTDFWENSEDKTKSQKYGFIDGMMPISKQIWKTGEILGEFAADTKIAYDYWQKMKQAGRKLVNTYGSGQGNGIDNYYHPLLQCQLAKISPTSRRNGIALGYAKEYLMDYPLKRLKGQNHDEIMKDSIKDLQNNLYGSNLGHYNQNKSCTDLLEDKRTENMRKLGIK